MGNTLFYKQWNLNLADSKSQLYDKQICLTSRGKLWKAVRLLNLNCLNLLQSSSLRLMGKHQISWHLKTVNVLKHRILFRVLSMFSLKWRNVLFAKDDGKGNFLAVTCSKSGSIQVVHEGRKEVLFTEGTRAGKQLHSRCMKPLNVSSTLKYPPHVDRR